MTPITKVEMENLKQAILDNKEVSETSKQIALLLIQESKYLTKEVCITLTEGREGYTSDEIEKIAIEINSRITKTAPFLKQLEETTEFSFSMHYGDFNPNREKPFNNDGQFFGCNMTQVSDPNLIIKMPCRYTFWFSKFSKKAYTDKATLIVATRESLEKITSSVINKG